ncbi:Putative beta-barrel porin-2, OmpL-like. bbp2 [Chryseobacterium soldanellicola]|uniref:Putative beta-barrel porin-2, OmpL-like. bbp2 n=1 Tax=Chryseobacterium soldanellicola TaxID=311333 RepID=A0A1H0YBW7_9FLAO|nr:porin [Chryseobacterium soldanellicola]SDQ12376.1 Putative beta-barrel porin-2, OmpL-like. bbp2 [Chryseobacterium soldanellicola]
MKKYLVIALMVVMFFPKAQQSSDSMKLGNKITFSAYAELFYSYDFNEPGHHKRQDFLYSYNRHNELNLNLGLVKATYQSENLRANLALMAGTYAQDNMAAEQEALRYVNEASIGIKISKNKKLWIDAGIMPSHIGWESAIGKDNMNLTRSLAAENSPYFETGAKISYTSDSGKWFLSGLVLNGWQRIAKADGNQSISFGHQVTYKPSDKITLNSSSFIGNDKAKEEKRMRYFHDLHGIFQLTKKFSTILGLDIGAEQKSKGSKQYNIWYTPNMLMKYQFDDKWALAGRLEYYNDKNGVIISTKTPDGFQTFGYSLNIDYAIFKNVVFRTEARGFTSKDAIFVKNNELRQGNFFITTSLAAWF